MNQLNADFQFIREFDRKKNAGFHRDEKLCRTAQLLADFGALSDSRTPCLLHGTWVSGQNINRQLEILTVRLFQNKRLPLRELIETLHG